ncbi:hypothetical protein PR048_032924 [Dryococelus australis]|uniref:Transposase n=1 Tax=Dryococelus australis TaxID=614101 RepID=A0ABQ9G4S3_9NEOP|nr:hypothetical protein PR048_032924 [Dryococelus australis]
MVKQVQENFERRFEKRAPSKLNLHLWEKKAFQTGSVMDTKHSGRPRTRDVAIENLHQSVLRSLKKSLHKRSAELGISPATLHRVLKDDLYLKAYKPTVVSELSDADHVNRMTACDRLLQTLISYPIDQR